MNVYRVRKWFADQVAAAAGPGFDVFGFGKVTETAPSPPYAVVYGLGTTSGAGSSWERGLLGVAVNDGPIAVQVSVSGRTEEDALGLLDRIRSVNGVPSSHPDGHRVKLVESAGSPGAPQEAGTLVSVAERYTIHVEAT